MNIIYKKARFNSCIQQPNEPHEAFIADLHKLAVTCKYDELEDGHIRDHLMVRLLDIGLSKMQLDPKLTLQSATKLVRNSEVVKQQQTEIRHKEYSIVGVDKIRKPGHKKSNHKKQKQCLECLGVNAP